MCDNKPNTTFDCNLQTLLSPISVALMLISAGVLKLLPKDRALSSTACSSLVAVCSRRSSFIRLQATSSSFSTRLFTACTNFCLTRVLSQSDVYRIACHVWHAFNWVWFQHDHHLFFDCPSVNNQGKKINATIFHYVFCISSNCFFSSPQKCREGPRLIVAPVVFLNWFKAEVHFGHSSKCWLRSNNGKQSLLKESSWWQMVWQSNPSLQQPVLMRIDSRPQHMPSLPPRWVHQTSAWRLLSADSAAPWGCSSEGKGGTFSFEGSMAVMFYSLYILNDKTSLFCWVEVELSGGSMKSTAKIPVLGSVQRELNANFSRLQTFPSKHILKKI